MLYGLQPLSHDSCQGFNARLNKSVMHCDAQTKDITDNITESWFKTLLGKKKSKNRTQWKLAQIYLSFKKTLSKSSRNFSFNTLVIVSHSSVCRNI